MEFLKEVVERVSKDLEYIFEKFFKNGVFNRNFGILVDFKKFGMCVDGIDVV